MSDPDRPSSHPDFWDVRYEREEHLFGTSPNAFVAQEAHRLPPESDVVELGAGEGRTLAWLAREQGHRTTAVDFSDEALATAKEWAERHDLALNTLPADVRTWTPDRQWDAAVVTFLQLLPDERLRLYRLLRQIVRPGGWIFGEWFRPEHLDGSYDRMGPSTPDRMVPVEEVRAAFADDDVLQCDPADVRLHEGALLKGKAAVVRGLVRRA
ncbi:MAG: cyclopropane-fatty-acyl-phospholipid synthase family protein [Salinibacter sp.]